jgi:AcrR family transcriptional regulator
MEKQSHGDKIRNQIIKESINIFSFNGVEFTSLEEVAKSQETTKSNILYHFKSKEGLLLSCFRYIVLKIKIYFLMMILRSLIQGHKLKALFMDMPYGRFITRKKRVFFVHMMTYSTKNSAIFSLISNSQKGLSEQVKRLIYALYSDEKIESRHKQMMIEFILEKIFGMYHLLSFDSQYDNDLKKIDQSIDYFIERLLD